MLSMHDDETDAYSFFSLSNQRDYSLKVPDLRGKRICGSCYGWLITIDHQTLDLHLLNPLSRQQIKLPSPKTFPRAYIKEVCVMDVDYFEKVILSEDPSVIDDYIIMAIFSGMTMLAFCRPRKEGKWIVLDSHRHSFQNLIYYQEQFYAVNMVGALFAVEIDPQPKLSLKCHSCTCSRYLVEWSGGLLHVRRPMAYDDEPYADSSDSDTADCNWDGSPTSYKKTVFFPMWMMQTLTILENVKIVILVPLMMKI
ncbi:hypothetical protein AAC387_Pa06g1152 [Persea americana]